MNLRVEDYRYLIIGGAPKAGTTSLYKWLSVHPNVCPSSLKESRFFLESSNRLPSTKRYSGNNLQDYDAFFRSGPDQSDAVRIEASPDYLYSRTALNIADVLPHAKILFVLRDPVERMTSWYKYALQRNLIDASVGFEDYVNAQIGLTVVADTPIHLQALSQCCYENYLPAFRAAFGPRCLEIDFKELKDHPKDVMFRICDFVGLDKHFFSDYKFQVANESRAYRNTLTTRLYSSARRMVAQALHANPTITNLLRAPNRVIKNALTGGAEAAAPVHVSDEVSKLIRSEIERMLCSEAPNPMDPGVGGEN